MHSFFIPFSSSLHLQSCLAVEKEEEASVIFTQQFHDFYQMGGAKIISWKISNEKSYRAEHVVANTFGKC